MLFSGGKDSVLMLQLARKAFAPAPVPFPIMHVDTGHNFPEVIDFRDKRRRGVRAAAGGRLGPGPDRRRPDQSRPRTANSRNRHQTVALLDAIKDGGFDAVFGGGRRDEDKARAKERVSPSATNSASGTRRTSGPSSGSLYNGRHRKGEHIRVFPISDWTELDVWRYLAARRSSCRRSTSPTSARWSSNEGLLMAVNEFFPLPEGAESHTEMVRYRTVGDATSTGAVRLAGDRLRGR